MYCVYIHVLNFYSASNNVSVSIYLISMDNQYRKICEFVVNARSDLKKYQAFDNELNHHHKRYNYATPQVFQCGI